MENIREHIYLAALLHDIGKFYQRADTGSVSSSKFLDLKVKNLSPMILPSFNGNTTHKHALWTAQFIIDNEILFKNLVGANLDDLIIKNNLLQLAAGHHLPNSQQSDLGKIIKEADSLSSGMDRDSAIALKDDQDEQENNWDAFKKKRMTSILESIGLSADEIEKKNIWYHLPVESMKLSKGFFPQIDFNEKPDYEKLWQEFIRDFKFVQADSYRSFSETLLSLLFKYTSTIPASTINFADVSLYDHLKTTAAIAVCLYDSYNEIEKTDNPFLLIGADLSGIQKYIYQIVSKYAGKNLKGRSFYLRLLSDAVVRYILKELKLFQANVIYNSGGSFYILAPNTQFVRTKLEEIVKTIERKMFDSHGTTLFLAIDYVEMSKDALMNRNNESINDCWGKLFVKRDKKKLHKFDSLICEHYSNFFKNMNYGIETDSITGEGFREDEKTKKVDEVGKVKYTTYQQIELGKRLRDSELLIVSEGEISYWKDKNPIEPTGLGIYFYLLKKKDLVEMRDQLRASADKISIITFNGENGNCDFMYAGQSNDVMIQGANNIYGLEFYGGNIFDGRTFDEFCHKDAPNVFKRLGVLRMDVDNLGNIFQNGIIKERATLSRFAALSRSFDYFFSGYLNEIQLKIAPNSSFIVYSGGDDLFIVASWEDAIKLAKQINIDFKEFTCNNDAFSLSGGISIVTPKFPIMKAAQESEVEEKNAKGHVSDKDEKNSISFMDTPLNWRNEYPQVENLKDCIVELTNKELLPKSFIGKILQHAANAKLENHKIQNLKTYWMIPYDLGRMIARHTDNDVKALIDNCKREICGNQKKINGNDIKTNYHALELWAFAARWAELEIRTNKLTH